MPPDDRGGQGLAAVSEELSARESGRRAFASMRRSLTSRMAEVLRRDPEPLSTAVEVGLVDRTWPESPGTGPITSAQAVRDAVAETIDVDFGRLRPEWFKGVADPVPVCSVRPRG